VVKGRWLTGLGLALLLCSCKPEIGRIFWVTGDSIAVETLEELHFAAAGRDNGDVVIPVAAIPASALARDLDYFTGRFASAQSTGVTGAVASMLQWSGLSVPGRLPRPAAIVVSLGTNDTMDGKPPFEGWKCIDTPQKAAAALDSFLGALPAGVRVVWIVPGGPGIIPSRLALVVQSLSDARSRWPNPELFSPDASWYAGTGEDGIHFTVEGESAFAKAMVARLDAAADVGQ
jgi:lysophospholipase L1-like esterase